MEEVTKKPKSTKERKRKHDITKSDTSKRKKLISGSKRKFESTDETVITTPLKKWVQII